MAELRYQEQEPNELEQAIIEWDIPSLKKHLIDQNLLFSLGYTAKEINHMQVVFFGIKFPNPSQMTYFEKAVYVNDKKTVENYYNYMKSNKSVLESYGYTQDDLNNIKYVHVEGNKRFLTSRTDHYEIFTRLVILQNNKNKMAEMFILEYLEEASDLLYKKEAINRLVMIYREEEYLPERKDDFKRLISLFPEILEYSQLARSLHIELLYRDNSDEGRYKKICERGDYYEQQLDHCSQKAKDCDLSEQEKMQIKNEKAKYTLENKAKYLYAISMSKSGGDGWSYLVRNELHKQTNLTYTKDFLEASRALLKIYLTTSEKKTYSDILHTMAEKAMGKKGDANYGFLLYLNREFGTDFGIDWVRLEELYKNADVEIEPFDYNGSGTYLYALAQEYIRINKNIDGFPYKSELLRLKKEFYCYYNKKIEYYLMEDASDCETIRNKIGCINNSILNGERKFLQNKGYGSVEYTPRYLCFFPEQDRELYDKYEDTIQKDLVLSIQSNSTRDRLRYLTLSNVPNPAHIFYDSTDEALKEISFYVWKIIQSNFNQSKDQWLVLGKIYEYYMNGYEQLRIKARDAEKKIEYKKSQLQWAKKVANALRIRAELYFVYYDWYDLYQFYLKQAYNAVTTEEKSDWTKLAFELYLEIAYKIQNDTDQVGMHFEGLGDYFQKPKNYFKICIMNEKSIATRYIEELATLYYQYRQYRYLRFAFEIAKVTGEYELYLRKFLKALVQWEMVQLISNIHYLLQKGEYSIAQRFYNYSVEHINNIPQILLLTHELIEGLVTAGTQTYKNILNLLESYPKIKNRLLIEKKPDESSMLDNIMVLEFIKKYYESSKELIGEQDCSSIQYALYLQFQHLYASTRSEEYLVKMFEALAFAATEKEYLPHLYKVITLCYRYERLNSYLDSTIDKMNLSPEIADKLKGYQDRLGKLKSTYDNGQSKVFQELCDLTIHYSYTIINDIKEFIKKHILSDGNEVTEDLRDYLMSFDMIGKVWLQLYFEEKEENNKERSFADYTIGFHPVNQVIMMLEDSKKSNTSMLNLEILKICVFQPKAMDDPYKALVQDYLRNAVSSCYEGLEILHYFFALMAKEEGASLYEVIDTINKESLYENSQCIVLLEQLYKKTKDLNYLTAIARQQAKACNYEEAERCYREIANKVENNPKLAKQYAYIKTQTLAISLLILANNNEKIKVSAMEDISAKQVISAKEVCEVLAYLSSKYPIEVARVLEGMDEEERNVFHYIHLLISFEKNEYENEKNKHSSELSLNSYEELQEQELFKTSLLLKETRYFSYLLPNLYQRSKNADFKYSIESHKDNRIQTILKEANNKPILVLFGQKMRPGQKLIFMDYGRQARNVNVNLIEENQDIPMLQEVINKFYSKEDVKPISDLFLQLERERSNHSRKNLLLHILADQSYPLEDMERDTLLQRKLQLSKAELGYLLHLEEFEKKNYETSVRVLHEGMICLGSSKSDCLSLLEQTREQYCKVLEAMPELPFDRVVKFFPVIIYDLQKIVQLLNNWNNPKNVFIRDMVSILGRLQTFENPINQDSDIVLLETVMEMLGSLGRGKKESDKKFINSITNKWEPWIYSELIQIVNKDTIRDIKYFIDRKESKRAYKDFYLEVIEGSCNINLYGPKGMGVSSLLKQCYQGYQEEALRKGNLFLHLDCKELSNSNGKEDFSKLLFDQVNHGVSRIHDFNPLLGAEILTILDRFDGSLSYLDGIKNQEDIKTIHLFLDHYEGFQETTKAKMDLLLYQLGTKDIQLVLGSETISKVKFVEFSEIELKGFSENETRDYIRNRMKYKGDLLQTLQVEELYKLTGGIPALLSYMVEYFLEHKTFTEHDGKAYLLSKAELLFEHWDMLWKEKLNREDNAAYRSHIMAKNGHVEQDINSIVGEWGAKIEAKVDAKIEANMNEMKKMFDIISKDIYISKNNLIHGDDINLESYQKSIRWTQEVEVDMAEFGISEEFWEVIKKEKDVYQYIKYGEALRRLTHEMQLSNYDYSVFALNYCLAFELISNKMLKGFLMKKIPNYDVTKICKERGITKLKDSRATTNYTLGNYAYFLSDFNTNYKKEISNMDFAFDKFYTGFSRAKDIRNMVAHVGDSISDKVFPEFLSLLFGGKNNQEGQPPVFEGICRIIRMN